MKDDLLLVQPTGADGDAARLAPATCEVGFAQGRQAFGKVGEDLGCHFAPAAVRADNARQGNAHETPFREVGGHYSRISKVRRFLNFIPAAPRMVRMDLAVRPWRPITFPRSLGWTRSSSTVTCSPSIART